MAQTRCRCRGLQQLPGGRSRGTCRIVHKAYISHITWPSPQGRGHSASRCRDSSGSPCEKAGTHITVLMPMTAGYEAQRSAISKHQPSLLMWKARSEVLMAESPDRDQCRLEALSHLLEGPCCR